MLQTKSTVGISQTSAPRDPAPEAKFRSSCDACLNTKVKCSQTKLSCARCFQHGRQCVYSQYRKIGRPSGKASGALTLPTEHQQRLQRTAGETERESKKQGQKRQTHHIPTQARAYKQHGKRPLRPQNVPGDDAACTRVNAGQLSGTLTAQSSSNQTGSDLEDSDADNSASLTRGPLLSFDQNIPDLGLMTDFTNSLDYGIEGIDWSALGGASDVPVALAPKADQVQMFSSQTPYQSSQPYLDDTFARHTSSSSCDSRDSSTASLPYPSYSSPTSYSSPPPQKERLFSSHQDYPFFTGSGSFMTESLAPEPKAGSALNAISPFFSWTATSRARKSDFFSISCSRCTLQCHANLTNHLTDIGDLQAKDVGVDLDVLLILDDHVRKARDKILRCPFCLARPSCAQTLMLITMVVSNLLGLFEQSCGTTDVADVDAIGSIDKGWKRADAASNALPTSKSSLCTSKSRSPLPYTIGHLTVGDIQLEETVKLAFSRRLVRMYLDRQIKVLQQLNQLLEKGERENVSFKVTQKLLIDLLRRLEYFIGFVTLTDSLDINIGCQ
ncbi:hypothetical protein MMC32_005194 [Xylographa parallela]|nr:hypothetical protein [Xylographa parallela]